jgi:hypothetical protein
MHRTGMKVVDRLATETRAPVPRPPQAWLTKPETLLAILFLVTLPLVNPWVRGDGVGYYAFARSLLVEHRLNFVNDWLQANDTFRAGRVEPGGRVAANQYTPTGLLNNHFAVGPAILWAPFLIAAHLAILAADRWGAGIPSDGFSRPYRLTAAFATALYGFLAVWLSFRLARKYVPEGWAFAAAIAIWFGSSLPVYMYFDPFWSHAPSAFAVTLFVWYWDRTRSNRTESQWLLLGAAGGLMVDVYYPTAVLFLLPLVEWLWTLRKAYRAGHLSGNVRNGLIGGLLLGSSAFVAFLPTLAAKRAIYGSAFQFGYTERWFWWSPALLQVCFSSDHGLFTWTPLLLPAAIGLFLLRKRDAVLGVSLLATFCAYLYVMGCYENWDGIASFGNRFFVSLTPLFVLGLAAALDAASRTLARWGRWAPSIVPALMALAILWNVGLIYQWGTHLVPARGPIAWREAAYNQIAVVPVRVSGDLETYLLHRGEMMQKIERQDAGGLQTGAAAAPQRKP